MLMIDNLDISDISEKRKEDIKASIRNYAQFGGISIVVTECTADEVFCTVTQIPRGLKQLTREELENRVFDIFHGLNVVIELI